LNPELAVMRFSAIRTRPRTSTHLLVLGAVSIAVLAAAVAVAAPPGFAFLEIPTGARAASLGGATTSMASGAEALYANPAALEFERGIQVSAGHSELVQKLRHDYFAVGGRAFGGGLGASVRGLYTEPIEERDETGTLIGSFGAHDLEFAVAYGTKILPAVRLGLSVQVLRERISNESTTAYGFGFGTTWEPSGHRGLRTGISVENLGPATHYTIDGVQGQDVALPSAVQGGASYGWGVGNRMNVRGALESRFTRGRNGIGMVGAELSDVTGASIRLGLRVNDDASSFSAGAGYAVRGLQLDYAWVPFQLDLGDTHRFSFTGKF
jgi:hypothetical protein